MREQHHAFRPGVRDEPRPIPVNARAVFAARFSRSTAARPAPQMQDKGNIGAPVLGREPTPAIHQSPCCATRRTLRRAGRINEVSGRSRRRANAHRGCGQGKLKGQPTRLATKPGNFEELRDNILLAFFQKHLNCSGQLDLGESARRRPETFDAVNQPFG